MKIMCENDEVPYGQLINCSIQVTTLLQSVNLNLDYGDEQSTTLTINGKLRVIISKEN